MGSTYREGGIEHSDSHMENEGISMSGLLLLLLVIAHKLEASTDRVGKEDRRP